MLIEITSTGCFPSHEMKENNVAINAVKSLAIKWQKKTIV